MRRAFAAAVLLATVGAASACSSTPDPKAEWTGAMKAAGFVPTSPHTYDEMFEASKGFCGAGSALGIANLARTALDPGDKTAMPAPGKDPDAAAQAYGNATWTWACGHQQ